MVDLRYRTILSATVRIFRAGPQVRVLHLAAWWPSRIHPHHGNFVQKHVRLLARTHEVVVVTVQEDTTLAVGSLEVEVRNHDGYALIQVYYGRPKWLFRAAVIGLRANAYRLGIRKARAIVHGAFELIHAHITVDAGIVAYLLHRWWAIPYVITEHSTRFRHLPAFSGLERYLSRVACRNAAYVLPVTDYLAQGMRRNGLAGNYRVVGNVVNTDLFCPSPARPLPNVPFRLLHVSNLNERQKNIRGILNAYAELIKGGTTPVRLTIAGDGDSKLARTHAATLNLGERIQFTGPHTEQEVAALMRGHDAFLLFSNYETQGVVLLEAQACGLPVVATAVGGVVESVEPSTSQLVGRGNEQKLVRAMRDLLGGNAHHAPERARAFVVARYSEAAVATALNTVYQSIHPA